MYFPYLRGKQYEVLAVRDSGFLSSNRIIPVFEPTTLAGPTPFNRFLRIANNGVKFSVIVNSVSGKPPPALANTIQVLDDLICIPETCSGVSIEMPPWRCSALYQRKNERQKVLAWP